MQTVTLIIDKRKELSTKYKKLLKNEYSVVFVSSDIISALKFIQEQEPDLIIISDSVDEDLPDFCRKIRAMTYNMRPIIIALSKSAELDDKLEALAGGADDFISEPVNPKEFTMRIKAHLRREFESNLDSKKLLPNRNYSMRALKRILISQKNWACLYITIENFENYMEVYSRLASDKLIQTFSAIITSALNEEDYLGSVKDNGFIVITDSLKAEKIANFLIFAFNMVVEKFYSAEDLERGYVIMQGDSKAGRRSDFVYTTIGVITSETKNYKDNQDLVANLMSIHNLANINGKSNYLIERAKLSGKDSISVREYNNKISIIEPDASLTLLLSTILGLQGYEVLEENSTDIPAVLIIDAGDTEERKGIKICKKIKNNPQYANSKIIVTSIFHEKEPILSAGADLYLPKPYDINYLVSWVNKFIKEANT